jgi:hypothetical protein
MVKKDGTLNTFVVKKDGAFAYSLVKKDGGFNASMVKMYATWTSKSKEIGQQVKCLYPVF